MTSGLREKRGREGESGEGVGLTVLQYGENFTPKLKNGVVHSSFHLNKRQRCLYGRTDRIPNVVVI